jgi:hypothetical protein
LTTGYLIANGYAGTFGATDENFSMGSTMFMGAAGLGTVQGL